MCYKSVSRAFTSDEEALAMRYADECARTLLAYHRAENSDGWHPEECRKAWAAHSCALYSFENAFPCSDWEDLVEPALMRAVEESRP
jgi:hypothetical protein